MRTTSTLVGLVLLMMTATARADEADPAAAPASTSTSTSTSTATPSTPTTGHAADAKPPATAPSAPAAEQAAAALSPEPGQAAPRKLQVGVSFLPMAMGRYTYSDTFTSTVSAEAHFAYGFGLSVGYEVLPGLIVGFSPQAILNVQPKPSDTVNPAAMKQVDLLARVAYAYRPVDTISVYAEVLPGYSLLLPSDNAAVSKGLVVALGAGVAMDMTDRFFVSVGGGYQLGFQSQSAGIHQLQLRTKYVRVALGGGMRF
jgi:hypothetical protein